MLKLLERPFPDKSCIQRVKQLVSERFHLSETNIVPISELRCLEKGSQPIETVVTARLSRWFLTKLVHCKPYPTGSVNNALLLKPQR